MASSVHVLDLLSRFDTRRYDIMASAKRCWRRRCVGVAAESNLLASAVATKEITTVYSGPFYCTIVSVL